MRLVRTTCQVLTLISYIYQQYEIRLLYVQGVHESLLSHQGTHGICANSKGSVPMKKIQAHPELDRLDGTVLPGERADVVFWLSAERTESDSGTLEEDGSELDPR